VIADVLKGAALLFCLVVLQVSAAPQVSPYAGGPDLVIVLFAPLGTFSLLYVVAGYAVGRHGERRAEQALLSFQAPPRPRARLTILAAALLVQVGYALLQALLGRGFPVGVVVWQQMMPSLAQTAVFTLLCYPLLRRVFRPRPALDVSAVPAAHA
jgi:hypothetical protein